MLAGDGGDELFGGNSRCATQSLFELYHTLPGVAAPQSNRCADASVLRRIGSSSGNRLRAPFAHSDAPTACRAST